MWPSPRLDPLINVEKKDKPRLVAMHDSMQHLHHVAIMIIEWLESS